MNLRRWILFSETDLWNDWRISQRKIKEKCLSWAMPVKTLKILKICSNKKRQRSWEMECQNFCPTTSFTKTQRESEEIRWCWKNFMPNSMTTTFWRAFMTIFSGCSPITMDLPSTHQVLLWITSSQNSFFMTKMLKLHFFTPFSCLLILWGLGSIYKLWISLLLAKRDWEMWFWSTITTIWELWEFLHVFLWLDFEQSH